jgi:UDP-glucose 4-epimerase
MLRETSASDLALRAVLLRYFNPIGAHPSATIGELPIGTPNNLVPFITQAAAGLRERLTVFGNDYDTPDGSCLRDYIHVVDLAKAHVRALGWMGDQKAPLCETFNLGTGNGNSVLEVVRLFEEVNGVKVPHVIGPRRAGDVEAMYADTKKSASLLGWRTELSLADSLRDAWRWQLALGERSEVELRRGGSPARCTSPRPMPVATSPQVMVCHQQARAAQHTPASTKRHRQPAPSEEPCNGP